MTRDCSSTDAKMMDAAFSTMSSIDICNQMEGHSALLQFTSSESGSPIASTPPLMHTLQPLLSDVPDTLADYVDRLPKEENGLISSVMTSFEQVTEQKVVTGHVHNHCPTSYAEQFVASNLPDVKPTFELQPSLSEPMSGLLAGSAVPYRFTVPAMHMSDNQSHYYFQSVNNRLQSPILDQSRSSPASVNRTVVLCHSSVANSPLISIADSSASSQGDTVALGSNRLLKADLPNPPKKPLSPYMRFSKGIWQQVKGTNPGLTVCEVGATIGRMWRELSDFQKQQFNEDFVNDKARYDGELQIYLIANGLQASDLVKPRGKKRETKDKTPVAPIATSQAAVSSAPRSIEPITITPEQMAEEMARTILESAGMGGDVNGLPDFCSEIPSSRCGVEDGMNGFLPHFSQVWSGQELVFSGDQMSVRNGDGCMTSVSATQHHMGGNLQGSVICSNQSSSAGVQVSASNSQFKQIQNFELGSSAVCDQQSSVSDPNAWLWSQIGFGSLDAGKLMVSAPNVSSSASNQKLYPLTTSISSSLANSMTTGAEFSQGFNISDVLEPGEVRVASSEANIINGIKDGHGMSELMLLREALSAKGKEAARLTRELERAYGLIQRLQQQNIMYQQIEWNIQHQQVAQQSSETSIDGLVNGVRS